MVSLKPKLPRERRVFCLHYGACLDRAVKSEEPFNCLHCPNYEPIEFDWTDILDEAGRCRKLLKAVFMDRKGAKKK